MNRHTYNECSSLSELPMSPGFTMTQSDQCSSACTGTKISFFSNTLTDFVQDKMVSTPLSFNFDMKWVVKK